MSDEESFVILGSCSPRNSLTVDESLRNGFQSLEISKIEKDSVADGDKTPDTSLNENKDNSNASARNENGTPTNDITAQLLDAQQNELGDVNPKSLSHDLNRSVESQKSNSLENGAQINGSVGSGNSVNSSLAASFIMGEVNAEVLKSSVYSQFPSICSMEACAEDVIKLQNFMSEYIELKSTLSKVNATMRQFYNKTQQWRDDMQHTEHQYKQQLQNCQQQIAMIRNENLELKQEMQIRIEQIQKADDLNKKEMLDLVQMVSEKSALVENLRSQIKQMEIENLASFEYISKHGNDTKQNHDYIARSEHLHALKEMERKMSAIVAENYELKDMQKVYIDEINCLKVNLTGTQELLQQSRRDIDALKANDIRKSERFTEHEADHEKMREEILLLRQQVDLYYKDFQMERSARETLVGEKDQLLQDLRTMQRTNQQLIEEQQRRLTSSTQLNASTNTPNEAINTESSNTADQVSSRFVAAPPTATAFASNIRQRPIRPLPPPSTSKGSNRFHCPICGVEYHSLSVLQGHVNSCLDKS